MGDWLRSPSSSIFSNRGVRAEPVIERKFDDGGSTGKKLFPLSLTSYFSLSFSDGLHVYVCVCRRRVRLYPYPENFLRKKEQKAEGGILYE